MADDVTFYDEIEAYCGQRSVAPGEPLTVHVSSPRPICDITIERWGAERSTVTELTDVVVDDLSVPADASALGCGWPPTVTVEIPDDWRSGFYLVTCRARGAAPGRDVSHAGFVVRPAHPTEDTLFVLATNTWNAYNTWGGTSLYTGGHQVAFQRPWGRGMLSRPEVERDDRKARPARWGEEPDVDGSIFQAYRERLGYPAAIGSTGWFTFERRFAEWAESEGFGFDYAVSSDLERPGALDGYRHVVSVGHDEYWSAPQRAALEAHVAGGGRFSSMSGNTIFWQVRLEADNDGSPGEVMVGHKYRAHIDDPVMGTGREVEMTGMWADPVVGRPEAALLGGGSAWGLYSRFGQATPLGSGAFTVYRNDHWLFADTGLRYGDLLGAKHGVVGYETLGCRITFDDYQLPIAAGGDGTPDHIEVVAFTPSSNLGMGEYPASISALSDQGDLEFVAERLFGVVDDDSIARVRHGNAVIVVCRPYGDEGGEVVTIGSTDWVFGLGDDDAVDQVTRNVLRRMR